MQIAAAIFICFQMCAQREGQIVRRKRGEGVGGGGKEQRGYLTPQACFPLMNASPSHCYMEKKKGLYV